MLCSTAASVEEEWVRSTKFLCFWNININSLQPCYEVWIYQAYKSHTVAYLLVTVFQVWQVTNGGMKGLANLQHESMGEAPRQQAGRLLHDDGFLMLCSERAGTLFLEDIDTTADLLEAYLCFVKSTGRIYFWQVPVQKGGSATWDLLALCSACRTSKESSGSSVRGWLPRWAFSPLGLSVSSSI